MMTTHFRNNNNNNSNNNTNSYKDNKVLPERFEEVEKFCETKLTTVSNRSCSEGFQFAVVQKGNLDNFVVPAWTKSKIQLIPTFPRTSSCCLLFKENHFIFNLLFFPAFLDEHYVK